MNMSAATVNERQTSDPTDTTPIRRKRPIWVKILLSLVAIIAVLAVFITTRPSDFRVSRSATMAAPPATVFAQVNDFHNWDAWSPWVKLDPNATTRFEGPSAGEGAKFYWSGDSNVGEGSMTIVESKPNDLVRIKLDFVRPFAGTSDVQFTFKPEGDNATAVTWSMAGKNNFMAKAIGLVMDCEKMTGDMFEQGFANMKAIVEKSPN
jgi:uncharacterized protein YndB with AHSA1/START domain